MNYSALTLIVLLTSPLTGYAQTGNNNNPNDDSGSDKQERLIKAVKAWKNEWRHVVPAKVTSYEELEIAIEALQPIDEQSLSALRLSQWSRNEALVLASRKGNASAVSALLQAGADVNICNAFGQTPLQFAAMKRHLAIVTLLITSGANLHASNNEGRTALHWATIKGDVSIVSTLLKAGLSVNITDVANRTPLHYAATQPESLALVRFLMARNAHINIRDFFGQTPLHYAAMKGHLDVVEALLKAGADMNTKDNNAKTPLDWAKANNHEQIVDFLSNWAAHAHNDNNNNNNDNAIIDDEGVIAEDLLLDAINEHATALHLGAEISRSFGQ